MKKEVVSYTGFSMMPHARVELLDNNKGLVMLQAWVMSWQISLYSLFCNQINPIFIEWKRKKK